MNMTIEEYRARLYAALAGFDRYEVDQAVNYYIELIEDAENPSEQMAKLGSPEQLAQRIIQENGWVNAQYVGDNLGGYKANTSSNGGNLAGRIIALVLTSPFWLTVFILIISLLIVVWSVFISLPLAGIAAVLESFRWIGKYLGYAIPVFFAGIGLVGLTLLLFGPARKASSGIFKGIKGFSRFLFGLTNEPESFDKKNVKSYFSKTALIIGALLTVVGAGISTPLFARAASHPEKYAQAMGLEDYEYEFSDIRNSINLTVKAAADLEVLPSDNGKMYLKANSIKVSDLSIKDDSSNTAEIAYESESKIGNFHMFNIGDMGMKGTKIYLYLPEKEYEGVVINSSLGNVTVNKLKAGVISVNCDCGNENLSDIEQNDANGSFSVTNDLGNITVENCTAMTSNANIIQSNGNIKLTNVTFRGIEANNDLGNITINSMNAENVNCKNSSGNIKIKDSAVKTELVCQLDLGNADIELNGTDYMVAAESDLGNVKINGLKASETPVGGNIPVRVNNNCGNITVNYK